MTILPPPFPPMPRLGLGTWPMQGAECQRAVESALGLGYRHLDTAEMYSNEDAVGAGLRASGLPRDQVFVTTKVWWDKPNGAAVRAAAAASLQRLGLDAVDLLLVHWPSPALDLPDVLATLAALEREGIARHVGVANFPLGLLQRAVGAGVARIACLQVEHHVMLDQSRLIGWCAPRGIAVTSYTPVAKGAFATDPVLGAIAARLGVTPTQVALAALLATDGVTAIPKSADPRRQAENLAALELRLQPADLVAIAGLPKDRRFVNPSFAPDWTS